MTPSLMQENNAENYLSLFKENKRFINLCFSALVNEDSIVQEKLLRKH